MVDTPADRRTTVEQSASNGAETPGEESATETGSAVRELTIPASLGERIDRRIDTTAFDSDEEYVAYVLDELLAKLECQEAGAEPPPVENPNDGSTVGENGKDPVKSRLESLGYL